MKEVIGVIGADGDLGSQLVHRLQDADFEVVSYDVATADTDRALQKIKTAAAVIHLTIPAFALPEYGSFSRDADGITVLHDSVMHVSNEANAAYFSNSASVAHMLMNEEDRIVVAKNTPNESEVVEHFTDIGMNPVVMPASEHDKIMAVSQAPLALLCEMIHAPLQQYLNEGLLTSSGQELAAALSARTANWTESTINSLLQNPYLHKLVRDMRDALNETTSDIPCDGNIKEKLGDMGVVEIPESTKSAQILFNTINRDRLRQAVQSEPDGEERRKIADYAREHYPLPGDIAFETI